MWTDKPIIRLYASQMTAVLACNTFDDRKEACRDKVHGVKGKGPTRVALYV